MSSWLATKGGHGGSGEEEMVFDWILEEDMVIDGLME